MKQNTDINELVCPSCGKSHYALISSDQTSVYYPPIFENGRNVNPDGNITTYTFECLECKKTFIVRYRYGKIMDEAK